MSDATAPAPHSGLPAPFAPLAPTAALPVMLEIETALARSQAALQIIPAAAAETIAAVCAAGIDRQACLDEAEEAGNAAIPLVRRLRAAVAERELSHAPYVHLGATSQDLLDTSLVLLCRHALESLDRAVLQLGNRMAELSRRHRDTVMAGRTLLQQAVPVTFGLKSAGWLDALTRHRHRLSTLAGTLPLQFGGAAGTLAVLGGRGVEVSQRLARELGLPEAPLPWHTQRDRLAELGTALAMLTRSLGKAAEDVTLLMQTEVAEAAEESAAARGGSSAMPQKRNPVFAGHVRAASAGVSGHVVTLLEAMAQEHERAPGLWTAERDALAGLFALAARALQSSLRMLENLEVDAERMRANMTLAGGGLMAESIVTAVTRAGRGEAARERVQAACRRALSEGKSLREALLEDEAIAEALDPQALDAALDPSRYLGSSRQFIDCALAAWSAAP